MALDGSEYGGVGTLGRGGRVGAGGEETLTCRFERVPRGFREWRDVRAHDVDVLLLLARQQGPGRGDPDTSTEIAHQIEQTRGVAHSLARNRIHADRRQRNEERRQAETLEELRPEDVPVAGLQV